MSLPSYVPLSSLFRVSATAPQTASCPQLPCRHAVAPLLRPKHLRTIMGPDVVAGAASSGADAAPAAPAASARAWQPLSRRIDATDTPVIDFTRRALAQGRKDALSLAQAQLSSDPGSVSGYAPNEGLPALREALRAKLASRNGLARHDVVVTPGCNQAFLNVLLSLADLDDRVVLFKPYYFDHLMALQMTGSAERVVYGGCDPHTLRPSLDWLRAALAGPQPPKVVVIVNPCNPTGVVMPRAELDAISAACAEAGSWLVLDNTYEDFMMDPGTEHYCPPDPHVLHLFSFSKAYGMMGWRVGYVAYYDDSVRHPPAAGGAANGASGTNGAAQPEANGSGRSAAHAKAGPCAAPGALGMAQLKVQDAVCIAASQPGQRLALEALRAAGDNVLGPYKEALLGNRAALREALEPLQPHVFGGEGAIYLWARLPPTCEGHDDRRVVEWLVAQAGVCVVPGSAFGMPGHIRCSFGNLAPEKFRSAAARLQAGLQHLVQRGPTDMPVLPP